ncbi:hypothetical protein CC79DRAFT_896395 [Sarocladium strictum]
MPPTRGKAACVGCRSRKLKCDGIRPICGRCHTLGRSCEWPRPQKRGPVKGYVELLENRLEETESALYRILCAMDNTNIIHKAFQDGVPCLSKSGQSFRDETLVDESSASAHPANKADSMIAHWEAYPLHNASDLSRWAANIKLHGQSQEEHENTTRIATRDPDPGPESTASASSHKGIGPNQLTRSRTGDVLRPQQALTQRHSASVAASDPIPNQVALTSASTQSETGTDSATTPGLNLPADFKKQFIW